VDQPSVTPRPWPWKGPLSLAPAPVVAADQPDTGIPAGCKRRLRRAPTPANSSGTTRTWISTSHARIQGRQHEQRRHRSAWPARPTAPVLDAEDWSAESTRHYAEPDPRRSVLGPHRTGEPRTTAGTSGHRTLDEIAGHPTYSLLTLGERHATWSSSLPTRLQRAGGPANEAGGRPGQASPCIQVSSGRQEGVRSGSRPACHLRAIRTGFGWSLTGSHGHSRQSEPPRDSWRLRLVRGAARHEREHQRPAASVLPQGHRPEQARRRRPRRCRRSPSTADPARPSDGEPQQRPSTNSYTPVTKPVLRQPLEPGQYPATPSASPTRARSPRSAPAVTATTTRSPRRSSGCTRPS